MHYSFLRIKSAKHQRNDGEKSPCRDGLKVSTATKSRRCSRRVVQLQLLDTVVQLKLYRMRSHTHAVIFFAT
ncbi:hypothetical protein A7589_11860 [Escherichia sp. MOD1-EC6475]|nr:hypothetical protein A7589_11860 [Escherichia sp. MOD1-EC6475]